MTPLSEAATELRLVVDRAEARAVGFPGFRINAKPLCAQDFRIEIVADLLDAMDRIEPGLGTRLLLVLYPHCDAQRAYE